MNDCAPEGLYRFLEPVRLRELNDLPEVPSMARLLDYSQVTRLALINLILYYLREALISDDVLPQRKNGRYE